MDRKINVISVIGAGYLGKQIIAKSIQYNYNIKVFDTNKEDLDNFTKEIKKKIEEKNLDATITQFNNIAEAVKDVDLVIEAVPEKLELKRKIFPKIEKASGL